MTVDRLSARDVAWIWLLGFIAAVAVGTRGIAYWDAGDYVRLSLEGGVSGLLLGRPLFLWISRALVSALEPSHAEPVLRFFWTAIAATAAPLLGLLGIALGLSRRASLAAALALALSPSFAHTAHQVLTDGPALALSLLALLAAAHGRVVPAGVILACAIATRETSAAHAVGVVLLLGWRPMRRSVTALLVTCAVLFGIVLVAHGGPAALGGWIASMRRSSSAHPLSFRDVGLSLCWILAAGPLPIVLGLAHLRRGSARVSRVVLPAAIVTFALVLYPDGAFSPRYVLATAPLLFLAAGDALARRPLAAALALFLPLALVPLATRRTRAIAERGRALETRIGTLPEPVLLVPGHYCPHARLALAIEHRRSGRARDVTLLCPGWDWPDQPERALDEAGRLVALDLADDAWIGPREIGPRDAVRAWASRHASRSVSTGSGFVVVTP